MTINKETQEKIRQAKMQGFTHSEIMEKYNVSKPTAIKYSKDICVEEEKYTNEEQEREIRGESRAISSNQSMDDAFEIAGELPLLRRRLDVLENGLEEMYSECNEQEHSTLVKVDNQINFLQDYLEGCDSRSELAWANKKYMVIEKKYVKVLSQIQKRRQEREKAKKDKYDQRYNYWKNYLVELLHDAKELLPHRLTDEKISQIVNKTLPYGHRIKTMISQRRLKGILESYKLTKDEADCIARFWH